MNTTSPAPVPEYRLMRSTNRICSALTLTVIFASIALQASANRVFLDDFSDGSVTNGVPLDWNGNPVIWTEQPNIGDYDATSGDYVVTPPNNDVHIKSASVVDVMLTDVSIRTQVRTSSVEGGAFVFVRRLGPQELPSLGSYFGGIKYDPNLGGTYLLLGRNDGDSFTFFGGNPVVGGPVLPFDVRIDDAVLQLDVIGNELKLWGWKAGDPMPDQPQLTATDNKYSEEGRVGLSNDVHNLNIATFRYVHVADSHIPEPTTLLLAMLGMAGTCCYRRRR
jgi:hypothetical protein